MQIKDYEERRDNLLNKMFKNKVVKKQIIKKDKPSKIKKFTYKSNFLSLIILAKKYKGSRKPGDLDLLII